MLRGYATIFLLASLLITGSTAFPQSSVSGDRWQWVEFTTESGLPSDHIYDLTETRAGTVWVGTESGLAWYDGTVWHPVDTSAGPPKSRTWELYAFSDDSIEVEIGGKFLVGDRSGFHALPFDGSERTLPLGPGEWLLLKSGSLYRYSGGVISPLADSAGISRNKTYWIVRTRIGKIYAITAQGLLALTGDRWESLLPGSSGRIAISGLEENSAGSVIAVIGTPVEWRGLNRWDHGIRKVLSDWKSGDYISSADINDQGDIAVAFDNATVELWSHGRRVDLQLPRHRLNTIHFVRFRANDEIWVGTEQGLFLYRRLHSCWSYLPTEPAGARNRVLELTRAGDGSLWIGTADGIIVQKTNGARKIIDRVDQKNLNEVTGIAEAPDGEIWISSGSSFTGAYRWDGIRWHHETVSSDGSKVLFHKIRRDHDGRLWFLGLRSEGQLPSSPGPGAYMYENGRFTHIGVQEGLRDGRLYTIDEAPDGSMVFGGPKGLSRLRNGKWDLPQSGNPAYASLAAFALSVDKDGTIWSADRNFGVLAIRSDGGCRLYTIEDGLASNSIWDVRIQPEGRIWFSTADGLSCYESGKWTSFNFRSGLTDGHLWPILPEADSVYAGTRSDGVAILTVPLTDERFPRILLQKPICEATSAHVRWLAYMPWNEIPPKEILVRYRLDNRSWSPWGTTREITYSTLAEGAHDFEIQAQNTFCRWEEAPVRIPFIIEHPLYRRPEFLIPTGGLSAALFVLWFAYLARRRRDSRALRASEAKFRRLASELSETEEKERRRMAEYVHDTIGQTLALCKIKLGSEPEGLNPEDRKAYLGEIRGLLDQLIQSTRSLTLELSPPVLYELGFEDALEWLTDRMQDQHNVTFEFDDDGSPKPLRGEIRVLLFHAVRELLVNVVKHAGAQRAVVRVARHDGEIRVTVEDDGRGFDASRAAGPNTDGGFGLFNIRERMARFGGVMEIASATGCGTRVTLIAPLDEVSSATTGGER